MKTLLTLTILSILFFSRSEAGELPEGFQQCISIEKSRELEKENPRHKRDEEIDESMLEAMRDATVLIPVVVHIVHDGGEENIADEIVEEQIEVLNEDFGRYGLGLNEFPQSTDMRIRFELAQKGPNGDPTNGITRIRSDSTEFRSSSYDYTFKRNNNWDQERYLNIWVVREIDNGTIAGYSYLPPHSAGREIDGIVMGYEFFGRLLDDAHYEQYNKGKTLTHELGHYLNLLHTWGSDNEDCEDHDFVNDTPPCEGIYRSSVFEDCPAPEQCNGYRRQIENYMDYSDDACSKVFTAGQKDRMRDAIFRFRPGLVSYGNMHKTGLEEKYAEINRETGDLRKVDVYPNPALKGEQDLNIYALYPEKADTRFQLYSLQGSLVWEKEVEALDHGKFPVNTGELTTGYFILRVHREGNSFSRRIVVR